LTALVSDQQPAGNQLEATFVPDGLRVRERLGRITAVSAEQLIALEAAIAELGTLYAAARSFTALQPRAEAELLPRLLSLGRQLRSLVRTVQLTEQEIERAAQEIRSIRSAWQLELERLRASPEYQRALAALAAGRQDELAQLIPHVFAGLSALRPAPDLYFPVSPSTGRRRPGFSPFLNAGECADKILCTLREGIEPSEGTGEWWETDFPAIPCAANPAALESPIALRLAAVDVEVAVFAVLDDPGLKIFTPRLRAPMSIALGSEATDEWWEAYEDSYATFREALDRELAARGHVVSANDFRAPDKR
jgi:hypothetical protein